MWCRILPREWDTTMIESFCELGVFISKLSIRDRSNSQDRPSISIPAATETWKPDTGVRGWDVEGAGVSNSREGSSELAKVEAGTPEDDEDERSRAILWSTTSLTWNSSSTVRLIIWAMRAPGTVVWRSVEEYSILRPGSYDVSSTHVWDNEGAS